MVADEMVNAALKEFKGKVDLLCRDCAEAPLSGETAGEVARGIQQVLSALGKTLFSTYLEAKEETQDIIVVDGEAYRFKHFSNKSFIGLCGHMTVSRKLFQNADDSRSYCPMDEAWGMSGEYLTMEVREAAAYATAHMTPGEAASLLSKSALFAPHATQIKKAIQGIAECVAPCREEVDQAIRDAEQAPEGVRAIVGSMDGVNVLLDEEGAKRGRPPKQPKKGGGEEAVEKGKKKTKASYKNAMAGVVSLYGEVPEGKECPERLDSRYVSHMPEDGAPAFKTKFEAELEAAEAQCPAGIAKVILCDGARGIWNYIDNNVRFDDCEKLIDYFHATDHLSLAAQALFGMGTPKAARWYDKYAKKLKEDEHGAQRVLNSIDYYAKTQKLTPGRRKDLEAQRTFFKRNKHRMTYADFRGRGLPIGSGPVEAACKSLVKTRLCRSGMRWSREGGQRILDLRTYVKSGRWEAFWKQYQTKKFAA